ncbi:MAG: hypothetical protein ABSB74_05730 [Tepidisphaeraceae bacterium]
MVKYMGLGIACLTLVLSGVTRAVVINTDEGNYGKHDYKCFPDDKSCRDKGNDGFTLDLGNYFKDECRKFEKDGCKDDKGLKDLRDCKRDKDRRDDKDCRGDKGDKDGNKDHCKIEWRHRGDKHDICREDKHDHGCDFRWDRGCRDDGCRGHHHEPVCVPAPASSALGGAGLAGIALMAFVRSRRSINA